MKGFLEHRSLFSITLKIDTMTIYAESGLRYLSDVDVFVFQYQTFINYFRFLMNLISMILFIAVKISSLLIDY